jgi:hypothetical protein
MAAGGTREENGSLVLRENIIHLISGQHHPGIEYY